MQALKGMTTWAAYSNFEEGEKGMIRPGYFADFTILTEDILEVPLSALPTIPIQGVVIGGDLVKK